MSKKKSEFTITGPCPIKEHGDIPLRYASTNACVECAALFNNMSAARLKRFMLGGAEGLEDLLYWAKRLATKRKTRAKRSGYPIPDWDYEDELLEFRKAAARDFMCGCKCGMKMKVVVYTSGKRKGQINDRASAHPSMDRIRNERNYVHGPVGRNTIYLAFGCNRQKNSNTETSFERHLKVIHDNDAEYPIEKGNECPRVKLSVRGRANLVGAATRAHCTQTGTVIVSAVVPTPTPREQLSLDL